MRVLIVGLVFAASLLSYSFLIIDTAHSVVDEPFVGWCEPSGECYVQIPVTLGDGIRVYATVRIGLDLGEPKHKIMSPGCPQAIKTLANHFNNYNDRSSSEPRVTIRARLLTQVGVVVSRCPTK